MITFANISKQYGTTVLLDDTSVSFHEDQRTGLVGINGSGKTTLLRMLSGDEQPDSGIIQKPADLRIGYLPQEVEVMDDKTPMEIVLEPFKHVLHFEQRMEDIAKDIESKGEDKTLQQIDSLYHAMEFHDAYSLRARAEAILSGLGVPEERWSQPIQLLSGGYRMRTVLGRLLLTAPDFLLLDEPTNHLDMDSLIWLEKYLSRQKGGMLIVSHDRDFLNRITTCTAEIGFSTITLYKGNYDQYRKMKEEALIAAENRTKNLETKIAQTERFVERFKAKATKASQAQSRMKQLEKLRSELPSTQQHVKTIDFSFPEPKPSGSVPVRLEDITAGYDGVPVIERVSMNINRGEKIAIVGPNGAGKSTLLKLIGEFITPLSGSVQFGHNATIQYFGQHQLEQLNPDTTLYDTVMNKSVSSDKTFIRNILGAFLFSGDTVEKYVRVLSGGEKARLVLATILANPGNVLLLDEPTNHLDIQSIEMLSEAMASFKGTILFVSHDEYFISRIATRVIEMRPGMIRDFPGSLADYRVYLEELFGNETPEPNKENDTRQPEKTDKEIRIKEREKRKKLTRTIEKLEREIEVREEAIETLKTSLNDPSHALDHELLHKTTIQLEEEETKLDSLMHEWESAHEEFETFM